MAQPASLIVFGPLVSLPPPEELKKLSNAIASCQHLKDVREALYELPGFWDALVASDSALDAIRGREAAVQLASWAAPGGALISTDALLNNSVRLSLTITQQLFEYVSYVQQIASHLTVLECVAATGGVQGLCAGLLSALAVAGSTNEQDLGKYGALAVRAAFAIGAYVDLNSLQAGDSQCLAVRWKSPESLDNLRKVLSESEQCYISVYSGCNDATITVPVASISDVTDTLASKGITVVDTNVMGRFHTRRNKDVVDKVLRACKERVPPDFGPQRMVCSNADGQLFPPETAFQRALSDILLHTSDWHQVLTKATSCLERLDEPTILSIGFDGLPQSAFQRFKVLKAADFIDVDRSLNQDTQVQGYPEHAVAVIGMSCKFPGADSVDEFWQLLSDGLSTVQELPSTKWPETASQRQKKGQGKFWGNFIHGADLFDHGFFKKSSREAASMDPQQRLLLQCAYQAMESAGYLSKAEKTNDIGCYLGLCATDYDANVASHPPNAWSTLGTLRAFLSGKISHYFGWSGPSITFDTACSSSAVAIHSACKALQGDDCSMALAGGVALFTSPYLFENLSAAHFLSPTGNCKPFDAKADGYCRGEGIGLVVLKKLSSAIADSDNILGVIAGSAINQNDNCVPITVPDSSSQASLFRKVACQAGIEPHQVTFVESHGTGTPIGDPIEMESIRSVFGGPSRRDDLIVSSVKGNIGHLEGASGVAGLIKAILQIEHRTAVRQASFQTLNTKIPPLGPDHIIIPTSNRSIGHSKSRFLVGYVNNYGAAGSNSAMAIMEPPRTSKSNSETLHQANLSFPIFISANSAESLALYCKALKKVCQQRLQGGNLISSVAFQLARQQNPKLPYALMFKASSTSELEAALAHEFQNGSHLIEKRPISPSLVLVFGGQVRSYVNLNKQAWQQSAILRFHLDRCDETLRSGGYQSIYPFIFQSDPIQDIAVLHATVFSLQYATAQAWIDSGLTITALLGHSLGQLTALCVSGVLSLEDGLKFVVGRASLIKSHWGQEAGAMIAIEADLATLSSLSHSLEIACYNGPNSHVLVGDVHSVDEFQESLKSHGLKFKRLNVTHGYHSKFTQPLLPALGQLAATLKYNKGTIPVETCTDVSSWSEPTAQLLTRHTRDPVFFGRAVERLEKKLGSCTWLEAGSDSSVTSMARRALNGPKTRSHAFQPVSLEKSSAIDSIVDVTVDLWKRGHVVQFWNFHSSQGEQHDMIRLPPYHFEKHRHWLELASPSPKAIAEANHTKTTNASTTTCVPELVELINIDVNCATFKIDSRCGEYQTLVSGHNVAGSPLCPATLYIEMAARACHLITSRASDATLEFLDLRIDSPLGLAPSRDLSMTLRPHGDDSWQFAVHSQHRDAASSAAVSHAQGIIRLQLDVATLKQKFSRYEEQTEPEVIESLYQDPKSESMRGAILYKLFSRVVEYGEAYQGLRSVAAKEKRIAGTVVAVAQAHDQTTLTRPPTVDSFMQVSGIHANSFHSCPTDQVFVFTKLDRLQFGPGFNSSLGDKAKNVQQSWIVYSEMKSESAKELSNDIFVFESESKRLALVVEGARFSSVRLSSLARAVSRADGTANSTSHVPEASPSHVVGLPSSTEDQSGFKADINSIFDQVCIILEQVADITRTDIEGSSCIAHLISDSLLMMEVIAEISSHFSVHLQASHMEDTTDVDSLVHLLQRLGCGETVSTAATSQATLTKLSVQSDTGPSDALGSPDSPATLMADTPPPGPLHMDQIVELLKQHLELQSTPKPEDRLVDMGMDSLLAIELANDMEQHCCAPIDLGSLDEMSTVRDLARLLDSEGNSERSTDKYSCALDYSSSHGVDQDACFSKSESRVTAGPIAPRTSLTQTTDAHATFKGIRHDLDQYCRQEGFHGFWSNVYPHQERLVLSYIVNAFNKLDIPLATIPIGGEVPKPSVLPKHQHLLRRLYEIMARAEVVEGSHEQGYRRTSKPLDQTAPEVLLEEIINRFPLYASEHRLLNVTASQLAECLTGRRDQLALLFANKANRQLLADVYETSPMCRATTRLLAEFLVRVFSGSNSGEKIHFLEVGGGTCGTTKYLVEHLARHGVSCTYTFTDISSAMVSAAKKTLSAYSWVQYATLDAEGKIPADLEGKFHAIISTNCIHATRDVTATMANLHRMLRPQGLVALVEFTRGLYWFDLVYGLFDGWWVFADGREHALADIAFWERSLQAAGYAQVSWSDGETPEAEMLRLICAFNSNDAFCRQPDQGLERLPKRSGVPVETVVWKTVDGLDLSADIYLPPREHDVLGKTRPVALLLHGGGHMLFTRKDIHMKHIKILLHRGFLPVSVDYRLCPEVNLADGPMTDACDALAWARCTLPHLALAQFGLVIDRNKLAAVGWSSGGHLAMTLAFTARARGVAPPDVVLAFYCPSNFEDEWWERPIYPKHVKESPDSVYDLLEGVKSHPIAGYKPSAPPNTPMTLSDLRWRLVIHCNWKAQLVPVLINGLPSKNTASRDGVVRDLQCMSQPALEDIRAVSPYAQILAGNYRTPTFIVHGTQDDLIPWGQTRNTMEALRSMGVDGRLASPQGLGHAFDLWPGEDPAATGWESIGEGYDFLCEKTFLT